MMRSLFSSWYSLWSYLWERQKRELLLLAGKKLHRTIRSDIRQRRFIFFLVVAGILSPLAPCFDVSMVWGQIGCTIYSALLFFFMILLRPSVELKDRQYIRDRLFLVAIFFPVVLFLRIIPIPLFLASLPFFCFLMLFALDNGDNILSPIQLMKQTILFLCYTTPASFGLVFGIYFMYQFCCLIAQSVMYIIAFIALPFLWGWYTVFATIGTVLLYTHETCGASRERYLLFLRQEK